jgi:Protein of unknown function (DUF4238)
MAEHRRQHYVPRCHFKPFSVDGGGNAINLLNIGSGKAVRCAPVKGQCAKDYMYGEDLAAERAFQRIEGEYARVVRVVRAGPTTLLNRDFHVLRFFAAVQHFRTEMAVRRSREAHILMDQAISEGRPAHLIPEGRETPDDRDIMRLVMSTGIRYSRVFDDLKPCLVRNATATEFVTSDDPAVFTSRYYFQKRRSSNFGLTSSGAMLILPLTPHELVLFYDRNVYTVPAKVGDSITLTKPSDVLALNELQYIKAARNIYFAKHADGTRIAEEFRCVESRRLSASSDVTVFVPDEKAPPGIERYRPATEAERCTSQTLFVALSSQFPEPPRWLSKVMFRSKPISYCDGSAAGHVRKPEWLTREGLERDLERRPRAGAKSVPSTPRDTAKSASDTLPRQC